MLRVLRRFSILWSFALLFALSAAGYVPAGDGRLSVDGGGNQSIGSATGASTNRDGTLMVFTSTGDDLVPGDTNGLPDVFLRDRRAGTIERLSERLGGGDASSFSGGAHISADGRYAVFESHASDLVPGDTNGAIDVFRVDLASRTIELVSVDAFRRPANGASGTAFVSADGNFVVFSSVATNLVAADTNGVEDVFLRDMRAGTTMLASVGARGDQIRDFSRVFGPPSDDGRYVVFSTWADYVVSGDANASTDVFLRDLHAGTTQLVSESLSGVPAGEGSTWARMTGDSAFVVFESHADDLVPGDSNDEQDVFRWERQTGEIVLVSVSTVGDQADLDSGRPWPSDDGDSVVFMSNATNLIPGGSQGLEHVYRHDVSRGVTILLSVDEQGVLANNGFDLQPKISGNGQIVVWDSPASNLVPNDTNNRKDVFYSWASCDGEAITVFLAAGQAPTGGADVILGTPSNDVIDALSGDDVVCGLAGDDTIYGRLGFDRVFGGEGADVIHTHNGEDVVHAGPGNDTVYGGAHRDEIHGGDGDDDLFGQWQSDVIYGDAGWDVIEGGHGGDFLYGGLGNDAMAGGGGGDTMFGNFGNDQMTGGDGVDFMSGGFGNDTLHGGLLGDTLHGDAGIDTLVGESGDDVLRGGTQNDLLVGQAGRDILEGGTGSDTLSGGSEDDSLDGGNDFDTCDGGTELVADSAVNCESVTQVP